MTKALTPGSYGNISNISVYREFLKTFAFPICVYFSVT